MNNEAPTGITNPRSKRKGSESGDDNDSADETGGELVKKVDEDDGDYSFLTYRNGKKISNTDLNSLRHAVRSVFASLDAAYDPSLPKSERGDKPPKSWKTWAAPGQHRLLRNEIESNPEFEFMRYCSHEWKIEYVAKTKSCRVTDRGID